MLFRTDRVCQLNVRKSIPAQRDQSNESVGSRNLVLEHPGRVEASFWLVRDGERR
jgi:hypothetical protein